MSIFGSFATTLLASLCLLQTTMLPAQEEDLCEGDPTQIILISVASDGTPGDRPSNRPSINYCGDRIAFDSLYGNFSQDDTPFDTDLFIHDTKTRETSLASLSGNPTHPSISAAGRFIAFESGNINLVPSDTNSASDTFVYDTETSVISRVSVASNGTEADQASFDPSISGDGSKIAFESWASNLSNQEFYRFGQSEIFVHDSMTGETKQVSTDKDGTDSNSFSRNPAISADGRWVAFESGASNFSAAGFDSNATVDIYVKNLESGEIKWASRSTNGAQTEYQGDGSHSPTISGEGRYVAFSSKSKILIDLEQLLNGTDDIFLHDTQTAETVLLTKAFDGGETNGPSTDPSISDNGRYVAFKSEATNLIETDTNESSDIFVHDTWTDQTKRVSVAADGTEANYLSTTGNHNNMEISGDGRYVVFDSFGDNLVDMEIQSNGAVFTSVYRAPNPFLNNTPVDPQDPSNIFVWTGDAGDGKWETAGNWNDAFTNGSVNTAPGDPGGGGPEQTIKINNADVTLTDYIVSVGTLNATGQLEIKQPLTIGNASTIEELKLYSELSILKDLKVSANTRLYGAGTIKNNESGANLLHGSGSILTSSSNSIFDLDPLLKTEGFFEAQLDENSSLTLSGGLEINGNAEFLLKEGTTLNLMGPTRPKSGKLTFKGDGSILAEDVETAGGGIENRMNENGILSLKNGIAATDGTFENFGKTDWSGGKISGGELDGESLTNGFLNENGGTLKISESARMEDGVILNKGIISVENAVLLSAGLISNRSPSLLELKNDGRLTDDGTGLSLIESVGGKILKTGSSNSQIAVSTSLKDSSIEVIEGTLEFSEDLTLKGHVVASIAAEAFLTIGEKEVEAERLTINGGGEMNLRSSAFNISAQVSNEGFLNWEKGLINADFWGAFVNKGGFFVSDSSVAHTLNGPIRNEGTFIVEENVEVIMQQNGAKIDNAKDSTIELRGPLTGTSLEVTNRGLIQFGHSSEAWKLNSAKFDNQKTVEALKNSHVEIGKVQQLTFSPFGTQGSLLDGEWVVQNGANLTMTNVFGDIKPIGFIAEPASVILHGSGKLNNLPSTAEESDLDQLIIAGILKLHDGVLWEGTATTLETTQFVQAGIPHYGGLLFVDTTSTMAIEHSGVDPETKVGNPGLNIQRHGVALINGSLTVNTLGHLPGVAVNPEIKVGNGGHLTGSGELTLTYQQNGQSFKGSVFISQSNACGITGALKIDGKVYSRGKFCPGNSPGILTINGDFTQEAEGVIEIELGGAGTGGTDFDQLIVNGTATLGGTLLIKEINDFEWNDSVSIPSIQATIFEGEFDQVVFAKNTSRRIATPQVIDDMFTVTASTIAPATFSEWRNAHFSEADQANEAISGLLSDPDGDNAANLLEYAFDGVPQFKDARTVLSEIKLSETSNRYKVKVKFPWAKGMTDVDYTLQTSPDLSNWTDLENTLTDTIEGEFADMLTVEAAIDAADSIPIYARLLVRENGT